MKLSKHALMDLYEMSSGISSIAPLNIMGLESPNSAILSATIFNVVIIIALIPLALRAVAKLHIDPVSGV